MTTEYQLLNVFAGNARPPRQFAEGQIGPFRVQLVDDYAAAAARLAQSPQVKVEFAPDESGRMQMQVRRIPGAIGEWVVTARAHREDMPVEPSILGREPIADQGLFDLCQLLTFVTGRSVTTEEFADRHNPRTKGDSFGPPLGTLPITAHAWNNRAALVAKKCHYALLTHNSAFDSWGLQGLAASYNTALNVILDQWGIEIPSVPRDVREELRSHVHDAVDRTQSLSAENREAYKAILGGRVMQGPSSLVDQLIALLIDLGIVPAKPPDEVRRRIQFVNAVRNKLTHSGQIPDLKGLDRAQSDNYCFTITAGVVPEINRQAIGRILGFSVDDEDWLKTELVNLQRFFAEGKWNNWPLETAAFHEWIESLDVESFFKAIGG
jgi:hypothetical protein